MIKKDRLFDLINGNKYVSVRMRGIMPLENEESYIAIAHFGRMMSLDKYQEMSETIVSLLNSQAEVIRLQAEEIAHLNKLKNSLTNSIH